MKGCLILHGQMRCYTECIPKMFENLLDINDIDIFISTEKTDKYNKILLDEDIIKINYKNKVKQISFMNNTIFNKYKNFLTNKLNILYDEKDDNRLSSINTFLEFHSKFLLNINQENTYKCDKNKNGYSYSERELMIYIHIMNSFEMISTYDTYDYIILYRPDIYINSPLYIKNLDLTKDNLYYHNNYMMIFAYKNLYKFNSFDKKILTYSTDYTDDKIHKIWKLLVENQLSQFLLENFNVIWILSNLGHIRVDNNNIHQICTQTIISFLNDC